MIERVVRAAVPTLMEVLITGQKRQAEAAKAAYEAAVKLAIYERDERAALAEFDEAKKKMRTATAVADEARKEVKKLNHESVLLHGHREF